MKARDLSLDFSGRKPAPPRAGLALLVAGAALLLWAGGRLFDLRHDEEAAARRLATRAQPRAPADGDAAKDPRLASRLAASLKLAGNLQSPWAGLLDAIESTRPPRVALLSVEPSAHKRSLTITAEAGDVGAMLAHVAALQRDARLRDMTLLAHQRDLQQPGTPIRYRVQGEW